MELFGITTSYKTLEIPNISVDQMTIEDSICDFIAKLDITDFSDDMSSLPTA
jgi:hypothetical protein